MGSKLCLNAFAAGAVARTPLWNLTVLPEISQLHLSLFEGKGWYRVESGVYQ